MEIQLRLLLLRVRIGEASTAFHKLRDSTLPTSRLRSCWSVHCNALIRLLYCTARAALHCTARLLVYGTIPHYPILFTIHNGTAARRHTGSFNKAGRATAADPLRIHDLLVMRSGGASACRVSLLGSERAGKVPTPLHWSPAALGTHHHLSLSTSPVSIPFTVWILEAHGPKS